MFYNLKFTDTTSYCLSPMYFNSEFINYISVFVGIGRQFLT
jgi:hypothetical protein